tara:strand:+ start:65 stop:1414 length:1350 start_codon:yes stop_codon:yes gene_type:complete
MDEFLADTDINIDNYSIEELLNLLELNNPSKEDISKKINYLNENYFKNNNEISSFFSKIQNKLLNELFSNENEYLREDILITNKNVETFNNINDNDDNNNDNDNDNTNDTDNDTDNDNDNNNIYDNENNYSISTSNNIAIDESIHLIKKDTDIIKNYIETNFLHFNTIFRNNSINNIPTNSNFVLSSPINNISLVRLKSINLKLPFLISEEKNNNCFDIEFYSGTNVLYHSEKIIIENGYYSNENELLNYLNDNYFINSSNSSNDYMKNIEFFINKNNKKSIFKYTSSGENYDISFFKINFKKYYSKYFSLANIFGFENNINEFISENNIIQSKYTICLNNDDELYFCFDEFQSNIIESHKLYYINNMSTHKILAKIDTKSATHSNNFYINDLLEEENTDNVRRYNGFINLNNFNIKIINYYGNIINSNSLENITFTLEIQINRDKLIL